MASSPKVGLGSRYALELDELGVDELTPAYRGAGL